MAFFGQRRYPILIIVLFAAMATFLLLEKGEPLDVTARRITRGLEKMLAAADARAQEAVSNPETVWTAGQPLFLFKDNQLQAWSTNSFAPELSWVGEPGQLRLIRTLRGDFVAQTYVVDERSMILSVVPLIERFRITNRYLYPTWNEAVFGALRPTITDKDDGEPIAVGGKDLFRVALNPADPHHDGWSLILLSTCIVAFIAIVLAYVRELQLKHWFGVAILVLLGSLSALRVLMIAFGFPAAWSATNVFDSASFASSAFNPSIGDLLFNSLLVLIFSVHLFFVFHRTALGRAILGSKGVNRLVAAALCLFLALLGFLCPFLYYETVFHNSSITLDWTQSLQFDSVRIIAFLSVLVGSTASFLFCHVWIGLASRLTFRKPTNFILLSWLPALALFAGYYVVAGHNYFITALFGSIYILGLYATDWHRGLRMTNARTYLYLVFAILCFALQASASIRFFTGERIAGLQYRFGTNFLVERDVLGEYLLNQASSAIGTDPFIQQGVSSPFLSKNSIRQKVRQVHLNAYFDRYDVEVHLYSPVGDPLDNQSRSDFAGFLREYEGTAGRTGYDRIYFVNQPGAGSAKQYVAVIPVARQERTLGYLALVLSLKKVIPQSVYPELLVDNRFAQVFKPDQYSYAIFQGNSMISSFGNFDYEANFDGDTMKATGPEGVIAGDVRHVILEGEGDRTAVVTTGLYSNFYFASNLAFWSLLGVMIFALVLLSWTVIEVRNVLHQSYATRIQLFIFLAFIVPLVAVSVTTLNWTSSSAEERLKGEFTAKARLLSDQLSPSLASYNVGAIDIRQLEAFVADATKLGGVDATIYSPQGRLIVTNQAQIFDNLIVSNLQNPGAVPVVRGQQPFIQEEQIGGLRYNNAYSPLRSPDSGEVLGTLSIPFFESSYSLEKSRIIILSNVQIVFIIILILFTILSFFVTRWLTFPLRMITRSLSTTTLKGQNTLMDWKADDEIGMMVSEYNRMVANLERSKMELARTQKESAWREMAQQVAHEIKNPLTPMKLTLQQLESLVKNGSLPRERAEEALKNLLSHVEILNEIATSFSTFARMPAPLLETVNIVDVLFKATDLYRNHSSGKVQFKKPADSFFVMGDVQLMTRIFSNLILNGLQSGKDGREVTVDVSIGLRDDRVEIAFRDNGVGIDPALRDKVFLPHFTTKQSGSGLGLAISRQGIEQSGGNIWFESDGSGTTFYISLPLLH